MRALLVITTLSLALVPVASPATADYTIRSDKKIGALPIGPSKLRDATRVFGSPTAVQDPSASVCKARWNTIGLSVSILDLAGTEPCGNGTIVTATVSSPRWHTLPGLRAGDSVAKLRHQYPNAKLHAGPDAGWWLIVRHACKEVGGQAFPGLLARTSGGKVSAFVVAVGVCE
jgi:hypothetical protein